MRKLKSKTAEGVKRSWRCYAAGVQPAVHAVMLRAAQRQGVAPERIPAYHRHLRCTCWGPSLVRELPDLLVNPHLAGPTRTQGGERPRGHLHQDDSTRGSRVAKKPRKNRRNHTKAMAFVRVTFSSSRLPLVLPEVTWACRSRVQGCPVGLPCEGGLGSWPRGVVEEKLRPRRNVRNGRRATFLHIGMTPDARSFQTLRQVESIPRPHSSWPDTRPSRSRWTATAMPCGASLLGRWTFSLPCPSRLFSKPKPKPRARTARKVLSSLLPVKNDPIRQVSAESGGIRKRGHWSGCETCISPRDFNGEEGEIRTPATPAGRPVFRNRRDSTTLPPSPRLKRR